MSAAEVFSIDRPVLVIRGKSHWYAYGGKLYPSVTTLLKGWPKPKLIGWAAEATAEYAIRQRVKMFAIAEGSGEEAAIEILKNSRFQTSDKAKRKGSDIHAIIAAGTEPPSDLRPYVDPYHRWIREHQVEVIAQEVPIINLTEGYGGTADLVCRFAGMTWVIDLKTGTGVYPEYHAQVAAYAHAEHGLPVAIDAGGVLHLAEGGPALHIVDLEPAYRAFLAAAEVARYIGLVKEES